MTRELNDTEMYAHQQRVYDLNKAKGWYDQPVRFIEAMGMLITEVDEAREAFLENGAASEFKSELADIYIRLLDDCARFRVDLATAVDVYRFALAPVEVRDVSADVFLIIRPIVKAIEAYRVHGLGLDDLAGPEIRRAFSEIYAGLEFICRAYGVELAKAFDLKMSVNWTRPYRHGNKHA